MTLVLASTSATRRALLEGAGVPVEAIAPGVDEAAVKQGLVSQGISARNLADALAELKAMRVSGRRPDALVIGCDQTLELDDGTMLDKPGDDLESQLRLLSGRSHRLFSAVVAVENGQPSWRHIGVAKMSVRTLSSAFIAEYVRCEGEAVRGCLGGYRLEGRGAQLFESIQGDYFSVLGLPLLPLLQWLRIRRVMTS